MKKIAIRFCALQIFVYVIKEQMRRPLKKLFAIKQITDFGKLYFKNNVV